MRRVVLDTETTGLDRADRVIEIGCVEMLDRSFTGRRWHTFLKVDRPIHPEASKVHGIFNEDIECRPRFEDIAEDFLHFISGTELIAHNAPFDVGMLDREMERAGMQEGIRDVATVVDTLKMARSKYPGKRNTLDALCKRYRIDTSSRTLHGALVDAVILADLYLEMTREQGTLDLSMDASDDNAGVIKAPLPDNVKVIVVRASDDELKAQERMFEKNQELKKGPARLLMGERLEG